MNDQTLSQTDGSTVILLPMDRIRRTGELQVRITIRGDVIREYAEPLQHDNKAHLDPIVAFFDGTDYWLADGFHRCDAYTLAGRNQIPVEVRNGLKRDALAYALGANARHGLQRTDEDKRHAVTIALQDHSWGFWSDQMIAKLCQVSRSFVQKVRASLATVSSKSAGTRTYVNKYGTVSTMETGNIGKTPQPAPEREPGCDDDIFDDRDEAEDARKKAEAEERRRQEEERRRAKYKPAEVRKDGTGRPIPSSLKDMFGDPVLTDCIADLEEAKRLIVRVQERLKRKVGHYRYVLVETAFDELADAERGVQCGRESIDAGIPYAVCPDCQGDCAKCKTCRFGGHLPRWRYDELMEQRRLS